VRREILCGAAFLVPVSVFCDFKRAASSKERRLGIRSPPLINTKNTNKNKNTNTDKSFQLVATIKPGLL